MAVTHIRRKPEELEIILRRAKETDLIRKADLLSGSSDPDNIFDSHSINAEHPFGVLVLFGNSGECNELLPDSPRVDNLDWLERLIASYQAYPAISRSYFEEKRQAYLRDIRRFRHLNSRPTGAEKERNRLETAVRNANMQKEWIQKENTDRLRKIRLIEEEIREYERALEARRGQVDNTDKIKAAEEKTGTLRLDIEQDTARLRDLAARIDALRAERAMTNAELSPTTSRLQELEERRLTGEHDNLASRLNDKTDQLKKLEDTLEELTAQNTGMPNVGELMTSIGKSRKDLAEAQQQLDGGHRMISNLDLRVEILAARLEAIRRETSAQPEEIEGAYIAAVARAEDLLTAWISASAEFRRILDVDGISGKELVEAIFFASGPLCAAGQGACRYLDGAGVSLDTQLLYDTREECTGFRHTVVFEQ